MTRPKEPTAREQDQRSRRSEAPPTRPVVPAIPSESAVGEEDPGDFENASIHSDDGLRINRSPSPPKRE